MKKDKPGVKYFKTDNKYFWVGERGGFFII